MTAHGDVSDALALIKGGALGYLPRPFDINDFISKAEIHMSCIADTSLTLEGANEDSSFKAGSGQLGKSPAVRKIERLAPRVSESDDPVLIAGESGEGK